MNEYEAPKLNIIRFDSSEAVLASMDASGGVIGSGDLPFEPVDA